MTENRKYDSFGKKIPKPKKEKPPKEKKKMGRPKNPNTKSREKAVFIVEPPKKEPKPKKVYAEGEERQIGRPKKVYTPEELIEKDEREKSRLENTKGNRTKKYVQPWCASPLKFRNKIDEYFDGGANTVREIVRGEEVIRPVYTWSGLSYFLGFTRKEDLDDFGKKFPDFKVTAARGKLLCERALEERLQSVNPSGAIFGLKNFGWTDNTRTDVNITINPFEKLLKAAGKKQLPPNITMVEDE